MKRIALTGGIAAGKSLVAELLRERGWPVVDADQIGHELLASNGELQQAIEQTLGPGLREADGGISRSRLGGLVFSDPAALNTLNELVFPYLYSLLLERMAAPGQTCCFVDAALIYEWGIAAEFHEVWVVWAEDALRVSRLMSRMHLNEEEAQKRLSSQLAQEDKRSRADRQLSNNGSEQQLIQELERSLQGAGLSLKQTEVRNPDRKDSTC